MSKLFISITSSVQFYDNMLKNNFYLVNEMSCGFFFICMHHFVIYASFFLLESKQTHCKEIITNGWTAFPYQASSNFKRAGYLPFFFLILFPGQLSEYVKLYD